MLKTITKSSNKKLGGCAATYRSGVSDVYGTCSNNCPLKPSIGTGSSEINLEYLEAVRLAVPEDGVSWTYTSFTDDESLSKLPLLNKDETTINLSADTIDKALTFFDLGYPAVVVVQKEHHNKCDKLTTPLGEEVKLIRCPAEYLDNITCANCGGDNAPLCARAFRDFIIKFTAHGSSYKKVATDDPGGCYGSGGPVQIQWKNTMKSEQVITDSAKLTEWVKTLPKGTLLRHHVVGDLG